MPDNYVDEQTSEPSKRNTTPQTNKTVKLQLSAAQIERKKKEFKEKENESRQRLKQLWEKRPVNKNTGAQITEAEAAVELGISQSTVHRQVTGQSPIGLEHAHRWAEVLNIDVSEIRPGEKSRNVKAEYIPSGIDRKILSKCKSGLQTFLTDINRTIDPDEKLEVMIELYNRQAHRLNTNSVETDLKTMFYEQRNRDKG